MQNISTIFNLYYTLSFYIQILGKLSGLDAKLSNLQSEVGNEIQAARYDHRQNAEALSSKVSQSNRKLEQVWLIKSSYLITFFLAF